MFKQIIIVIAVILISSGTMIISTYGEQTVTNSMTIQLSCSLLPEDTFDYGTVEEDVETSEETLNLTNDGGAYLTVSVAGKNWLDGTLTNIINGEHTKFATSDLGSSTSYASKTALNSTDGFVTFGTIQPSATNSTYWQTLTSLNNASFQGSISQTIVFAISCPTT